MERFRVIFTEEMANNNATKTSARVVPPPSFTLQIIGQLPAGHNLTGCDTVAKVGTKKELLNISNSFDPLIAGFGSKALDDDMLQQAEQFLINVVTKKSRSCSTFDKLREKLYHHQSNNKKNC